LGKLKKIVKKANNMSGWLFSFLFASEFVLIFSLHLPMNSRDVGIGNFFFGRGNKVSAAARRENRRVVRLRLQTPLRVVVGSIGGTIKYELVTRNISITGFFLDFPKPGRFPFTPASILEIWLELDNGSTIFFNGKMARVVHSSDPAAQDTGPGIGVKIVQIDKDNETILRDYINHKMQDSNKKDDIVA
jgi:hypothetical protein